MTMNKEEYLLYSLSAIKQVIKTFDVDIEITAAKDDEKYVFNAYNEIEKYVVDYVNSLQPYKFEDLKEDEPLYDSKYNCWRFNIQTDNCKKGFYDTIADEWVDFEENRFYRKEVG